MAQRELHRRRAAGRDADDRGAADAQRVEQRGMRVGLCRGRGVRRQGRTQIAEARQGDCLEAAGGELVGEARDLIVAAAGAVHQQHGGAFAYDTVLDRPAGRNGDAAAVRGALAGTAQIFSVGKRHRTMKTESSFTATPSTPSARTWNSIGWVPIRAGAARTLTGTMRLVAAGTPTVGSPHTWMPGSPDTLISKARACSVVFMICRR